MHTLRRSRSSASQCPTPLPKKLVVLGDANSGKSFLLSRQCHGEYPEDPMMVRSVKFEDYVKTIDSHRVQLMLVDANTTYDRLIPLFCQSSDVVLVCFAIDSPDSLDNVKRYWKPKILDRYCNGVPIILVGTKKDLRDDPTTKRPIVTREEAQKVAQAIGAVTYLECSAKLNDGVNEVFDTAAKVVVQAAKASKNDRRKSKCSIA